MRPSPVHHVTGQERGRVRRVPRRDEGTHPVGLGPVGGQRRCRSPGTPRRRAGSCSRSPWSRVHTSNWRCRRWDRGCSLRPRSRGRLDCEAAKSTMACSWVVAAAGRASTVTPIPHREASTATAEKAVADPADCRPGNATGQLRRADGDGGGAPHARYQRPPPDCPVASRPGPGHVMAGLPTCRIRLNAKRYGDWSPRAASRRWR